MDFVWQEQYGYPLDLPPCSTSNVTSYFGKKFESQKYKYFGRKGVHTSIKAHLSEQVPLALI
jgi:hypothetical protein